MQVVILAAGKGTRLSPLTQTRPKPLVSVGRRTILEHNLTQINDFCDEVIIVVNTMKEMIIEKIGNKYKNIAVKYVIQKTCNGTGGALLVVKDLLRERFIVLNGDDLYSKEDLKRLSKIKHGILTMRMKDASRCAAVQIDGKRVTSLEEKPKNPKTNIASVGGYALSKKIFKHRLRKSKRGELEITDYIRFLIDEDEVRFVEVNDYWMPVGYPWHLIEACNLVVQKEEGEDLSEKKGSVHIEGKIIAGEGCVIRHGVVIEGDVIMGKNCHIEPNVYIKGPCSIGDNCVIGSSSCISRCVIAQRAKIGANCTVGDSVLGEGSRIGSGTVIANRRFDQKTIKMRINEELIDTETDKLGAVIGDFSRLGANTSTAPGVTIGCHSWVMGNIFVRGDVPKDSLVRNDYSIVKKQRVYLKDTDLRGYR